ncbi:MAG: CHC2 zinc finger domain-containing protein, partial [Bacteroidota bacterium]
MTIAQIKARLSIREVLSHYGLGVNRNGMVNCPFHSDRKASMKVYDETNTVYCFAGGCEVSYLDVIDFIMKMDGSSKRAAIMKAKELVGVGGDLPRLRQS